jgi:hypothetical protein
MRMEVGEDHLLSIRHLGPKVVELCLGQPFAQRRYQDLSAAVLMIFEDIQQLGQKHRHVPCVDGAPINYNQQVAHLLVVVTQAVSQLVKTLVTSAGSWAWQRCGTPPPPVPFRHGESSGYWV